MAVKRQVHTSKCFDLLLTNLKSRYNIDKINDKDVLLVELSV